MKILKESYDGNFELAICGLGFESRAIAAYLSAASKVNRLCVLGYNENTEFFSYQSNKCIYLKATSEVFEIGDSEVERIVKEKIYNEKIGVPINVMLDITVMSRHRLATVISLLVDALPKASTITIVYSLSVFIKAPEGTTPVKKVCEIANGFAGVLGDLSLPTTVILGLGYEKGKALGVSNYLDSWRDYIFIPTSPINEFEHLVRMNNCDLISSIPAEQIFTYDVTSPYSTYLDLKSLILNLEEFSRPLLIPLGPKILSALCVILGKELAPRLPVWRVSSEYLEEPVDRPPSGVEIKFTLQL